MVYREEGDASFYSDRFQGKRTASGETFDQSERTAAHPLLPLGSKVTVRNRQTGAVVEVTINDRGPHIAGRSIDLSKAAAREVGLSTKEGVAPVEIVATESQVKKAIDGSAEASAVEKQLVKARSRAAEGGTPQPEPSPDLTSH